jgi:hypothetical protein
MGKRAELICQRIERMARSALSASSNCSINQRELSMPTSLPLVLSSLQALAMP